MTWWDHLWKPWNLRLSGPGNPISRRLASQGLEQEGAGGKRQSARQADRGLLSGETEAGAMRGGLGAEVKGKEKAQRVLVLQCTPPVHKSDRIKNVNGTHCSSEPSRADRLPRSWLCDGRCVRRHWSLPAPCELGPESRILSQVETGKPGPWDPMGSEGPAGTWTRGRLPPTLSSGF